MKNNIVNTEIIIRPKSNWYLIDFAEIWRYRELLYIFAWRDIKVRYKQTILGILWVIFQPLVSMVIFTVFFGNLAKIPSGKLPYSLFVLCGLVFWNFFSTSLSHASDSMVSNESIIKKIYFPKILLPLSSIVTSLVDFIINLFILIFYALIIGFLPSLWVLVIIPLAVLITVITSLGLGLFLSSFNVKYRDVRYALPFFIQILLFLTPVIYPLSIVSENHKYLMALNPMTSVVESVRMIFYKEMIISPILMLISFISAIFLLLIGLWYFRKTERFFADIV